MAALVCMVCAAPVQRWSRDRRIWIHVTPTPHKAKATGMATVRGRRRPRSAG